MPGPPFSWRQGGRADRAAIERFTCAPAWPYLRGQTGKRKAHTHPQRWAWDAQAEIHRRGASCGPGEVLLLGFDGTTLAAVGRALIATADDSIPTVYVQVIGIELTRQRGGRGVETLTRLIGHAGALHPTTDRLRVMASIHLNNLGSQALFGSFGLRPVEPAQPPNNPYALWAGTVGF